MEKEKLKTNLIHLIENGTTAFNTVDDLKKQLEKQNFKLLSELESWNFKEGNYFVTRNDASIIAFKIPKEKEYFSIITTHLDTPALLLKPRGENIKEKLLLEYII